MGSFVKNLLQKQYEKTFESVEEFIVIQTIGVNGNDNNLMRGLLKEKGIRQMVVRNAMMRRALEALNRPAAVGAFEAGPCTVVYGGESIVDLAKEVIGWTRKLKAVKASGVFVDGRLMPADVVEALSRMPNRVELQGIMVMLALSPGRRVAGAIAGPGSKVTACIRGLIEKKEKEAA